MSRRDIGGSRHAAQSTPANKTAMNATAPQQQSHFPVPLGEYLRMAPSTAFSQGAPMRAASAGRLQRAIASNASVAGEKILEPLPPPRADAMGVEGTGLESAEQRHLLEQRLQLLASHQEEQPASRSLGLGHPDWRQGLRETSPLRSKGRSKVKADTESIRDLGALQMWGVLDPFDPITQQQLAADRKVTPNRGDHHRSPSSSRERHNLENFKPSFRTDWLIALRRELLDGVQEEATKLRRDFAEAVDDMRADFADAMDGTLDPTGAPRPRRVEVDFTPVLQEIRKRKEELDQAIKKMREENNVPQVLRAVKEALEDLKKEQLLSKTEVVKVCKTSAGNVAKELAKICQMVDDNRVDLNPVLEAICQMDTRPIVDLDPVLHAVESIDVQPQVDLSSVLAAVKEFDFAPVLEAVQPPLQELTDLSKQLHTELEEKLVGLDTKLIDLDAKQDDKMVQMDVRVSERVETGTATVLTELAKTEPSRIFEELAAMKQITAASREAIGKIDVNRLEQQIARSQQELSRTMTSEFSAQLGKTAEVMSNSTPKVDFAPVLDAIRNINLGEVLRDNHSRQEAIVKEVRASTADLTPVMNAITSMNFADDFALLMQTLANVHSAQHTTNQDLEAALSFLKQADEKPPLDLEGELRRALKPVRDAIADIDVQPVVPLDEVMDALKDIDRKQSVSFASVLGTVQENAGTLEGAIAKIELQEENLANGLASAREKLEVLHTLSEASGEAIGKIDLDPVTELVRAVGKRHETGLQWLVNFLAALEVQPRVDLQPILEAISKIDLGVVMQRVDASHAATAESLQGAAIARREALTSLLEAVTKGEAETTKLMEAISRAEARLHICHEDLLESHARTDTALKDEFVAMAATVGKINVNPVVNMQPVVDEIAKIDVQPVVTTDTRPIRDIVSAGLARVEVAWAKVDLREVLDSIKKVDNRLLEAMVKIDGKDHNLIWTPPGSTW